MDAKKSLVEIPDGEHCAWFDITQGKYMERSYCGKPATKVLQIERHSYTFLCDAHYARLQLAVIEHHDKKA